MKLRFPKRRLGRAAVCLTLFAGGALAAFVNATIPSFRGAPLAEFAAWDDFVSPVGGSNPPDDPGTTPGASFDLVQTVFGGILTGGSIYNPSAASTFEVSHTPDPAIANADLETLVLQARSIGNEFDLTTFKLRYEGPGGVTLTLPADSYTELYRAPFAFGEEVEHRFEWNVGGVPEVIDEYVVRFKNETVHCGLEALILDAQWTSLAETYCTAGTSASGCQATLSSVGSPSATDTSGFALSATGVEGGKDGLFFFGSNGRQANAWGTGTSFQCVVPPVRRAGLLSGSGSSGACDGSFSQDLNAYWCASCPKPGANPGPGAVVQAQLWYRDPMNTSNQTTSLSNALEFTLAP